MSDGSIWQSIAATVVATAAVTVSIYVAHIQKRKLDLDLFDRRYDYYQRLSKFMRYIRTRAEDLDQEATFLEETQKAEFLFPKEVSDIITTIWKLGVEYKSLGAEKRMRFGL